MITETISRKNFLRHSQTGHVNAEGYVLMPALPEFNGSEKFFTNPEVSWIGKMFADYYCGQRRHAAVPAAVLHWARCKEWNGLHDVTLWYLPSISQLYALVESKPCALGDLNFMVTYPAQLNFDTVIVERLASGWKVHNPSGWFIRPYGQNDAVPALDRSA